MRSPVTSAATSQRPVSRHLFIPIEYKTRPLDFKTLICSYASNYARGG